LPEEGTLPCEDRYPEAPGTEIEQVVSRARSLLETLPPSLHRLVFSVDDAGVEEIDDAVSAEALGTDRFRVGVHIAAPGLVIPEESAIHARASSQCITVYQPDLKWPMLPRKIIEAFSLRAGERLPAISTYFTFAREGFDLLETEVRAEALALTGNFSYRAIEACLEGGFFPDFEHLDADPDRVYGWMAQDPNDFPWTKKSGLPPAAEDALDLLVPLARHLFVARNRENARLFNRTEYRIKVSPAGEITVQERKRNGLIEGVVAELMILTNKGTAARLADAEMPAIYRTQRQVSTGDQTYRTRADLTVVPREHAGLGTSLYCWATSPLRRYADLLNQRQLASLIGGSLPAFKDSSELLVRAKKTEFQNKTADQHQDRMERYWTLKFLEKQGEAPQAVELVLRRGTWVVRFTKLPLEEILDPRECSDLSKGPAAFVPERFDFYGLRVEGRIESA
jgi:exoribonuclease-2